MGLSLALAVMKCSALLVCSVLLVLGEGYEGAGLPQKDVELQEKYDNFFQLVDSFLWDSEEGEGRMYRRGYMRMRRPRILSVYNNNFGRQEPNSVYRSLADSLARLGSNNNIYQF